MTKPLLDNLETMDLPIRKPVHISPNIVVERDVFEVFYDHLVGTQMRLILGAEVVYSKNNDVDIAHSRNVLRRMLAKELYGNIDTELLRLYKALHEEDIPKCKKIVDGLFKLIE